jgi:hypothetical protein
MHAARARAQVHMKPFRMRMHNNLAVLSLFVLQFDYFASVLAGIATIPGLNWLVLFVKCGVVLAGILPPIITHARSLAHARGRDCDCCWHPFLAAYENGSDTESQPPFSRNATRDAFDVPLGQVGLGRVDTRPLLDRIGSGDEDLLDPERVSTQEN